MGKYKELVFLCTGNTCRSPMAEGIFKKLHPQTSLKVCSRGLMVFQEEKAGDHAIRVMAEREIDITPHRSKHFDMDEFSRETLVLTMTERHKTVILQHGFTGEAYSLREFVGLSGDVEDPYGGDLELYRRCADEIETLIEKIGGQLE
ncbi:MAG: low molecular weight protein arginine phosphatase [Vallitaleaceae bacterium]|nr:low molecular weight protein arginine phosphatase [Vallitaleaceae bacterium]